MVTKEDDVLVGLDTHAAAPELDWAAAEARARGTTLRIACIYPHAQQIWPWERSDERMITNDLRDAAHRRLTSACAYVQSTWPDLSVAEQLVCGYPADVLTELSESAGLTVVGSHHRTLVGRALLDSVSSAVAASASGPVVVVRRGETPPPKDGEVVAGVDGFDRTDDVLAFAFDYANRHENPLRAVFCWMNEYGPAPRIPQPHVPDRARQWLHALLEPWAEKYPDVEVRQTVNDAAPVTGLDAAAQGQALLVVGGRTTHHPRLVTLLGSVAQGVVHHASVPVAVIHPRKAPVREPSVAEASPR